MANTQSNTGLRQYAVLGAEQRLRQLAEEARSILQAFPELRARGRGFQLQGGQTGTARRGAARGAASGANSRAASTGGGRRKRRLSAAGRKAISEAAKKRWAEHRKQNQ